MEPNLAKVAEWTLMEKWAIVFPHLEQANLRLVYRYLEKAEIRHLYPELSGLERYSKPPASPEGMTIMVLADLVVTLLFPEKIIASVVDKAVDEIEEVWRAILQEGGGWSSKSDNDKRRTAALDYHNRHKNRLSYIKKSHLEDQTLYNVGGRQEKRNFFHRLLKIIIKEVTNIKLTSIEVQDLLKSIDLKAERKPLL